MKNEILNRIDNPKQLESLYRENKVNFKREFNAIYPEPTGNKLADAWNERLNYESQEITWGSRNELLYIIVASLIAGIIAKLPAFLNVDAEIFYTRNIAFIIVPILTGYFIWKNKPSGKRIILTALVNTYPRC